MTQRAPQGAETRSNDRSAKINNRSTNGSCYGAFASVTISYIERGNQRYLALARAFRHLDPRTAVVTEFDSRLPDVTSRRSIRRRCSTVFFPQKRKEWTYA